MKVKVKHIKPISQIINSEKERWEKDVEIIALLQNVSKEKVLNYPFYKLNHYRNKIKFLYSKENNFKVRKYLFKNFRIYKLVNDVETFTTSRMLSIKTYSKDIEGNINKLCALLYKPLFSDGIDSEGNEKDLSYTVTSRMEKDFSKMSYTNVAGAVFFFLNVYQSLSEVSEIYLKELNSEMMKIIEIQTQTNIK